MSKYLICALLYLPGLFRSQLVAITGSDGVNDTLIGDLAANIISGRQGKDSMTGSAGNDLFTFIVDNLDNNRDEINDFNQNEDSIYLVNTPPNITKFQCGTGNNVTNLFYNGINIAVINNGEIPAIIVTVTDDTGFIDTKVNCSSAVVLIQTPVEPSVLPTLAPLGRSTIVITEDVLHCDPETNLIGSTTLGCDGLIINGNGLKDLICEGLGSCNRTEFNVGAPDTELLQITFRANSFKNSVINAVDVLQATCFENACIGSILDLDCSSTTPCPIICDGPLSCQFSKMYVRNGGKLECKQLHACQGTIFDFNRLYSNVAGTEINCDGPESCKDAVIIDGNAIESIKCTGIQACQNINIEYDLISQEIVVTIICDGDQSCKDARIDLGRKLQLLNNGPIVVNLNIQCSGIESCVNFIITESTYSITVNAQVKCDSTPDVCLNSYIIGTPFISSQFAAQIPVNVNVNENNTTQCTKKYVGLVSVIGLSCCINIIFAVMIYAKYISSKKAYNSAKHEKPGIKMDISVPNTHPSNTNTEKTVL